MTEWHRSPPYEQQHNLRQPHITYYYIRSCRIIINENNHDLQIDILALMKK